MDCLLGSSSKLTFVNRNKVFVVDLTIAKDYVVFQ
jgi:hypothetical protein